MFSTMRNYSGFRLLVIFACLLLGPKPLVLGTLSKAFATHTEKATYYDAERLCRAVGWELLKIDSSAKQLEVQSYVLSDRQMDYNIWIDGQFWHDPWYFNNGETIAYKNFHSGYDEPDLPSPSCLSAITGQNIDHLYQKYKWNGTDCGTLLQFVCEK